MRDDDLVGFADPNAVSDKDEDTEIANLKKKTSKKSGGFQSMALSFPVMKGILERGYKIPTPIQRKVRVIERKCVSIFARYNILITFLQHKHFL